MFAKPAITPEARIAKTLGVDPNRMAEYVSWQDVGTAIVVNTRDTRWTFNKKGDLLDIAFCGEPDNHHIVNDVESFDWDTLDS